ncbi:unnamed protein product [marine sediment metagenome]|uniref:Uncharacterized protein n=1 Tax=marine sediment metagenome TaxID=412755 RepID=X1EJP7_9ZZZZ
MKMPSKSATKIGHDDEGISSVLDKPRDFKYTDRFLKWWYTEMGNCDSCIRLQNVDGKMECTEESTGCNYLKEEY